MNTSGSSTDRAGVAGGLPGGPPTLSCAIAQICRSLESDCGPAGEAPRIGGSGSLHRDLAVIEALSSMKAALDAAPLGMIVLDGSGALMFANAEAGRLLDARNGLRLDGRAVRCMSPRSAEQLARAISAVLAIETQVGAPLAAPVRFTVTRGEALPPLSMSVAPASPLRGLSSHRSSARVVLLIRDPGLTRDAAEPELASLYGLTRRETQLAMRLVCGETLTAAASSLGITQGTARQYLQRVFEKTGVQRQSELVRLILSHTRLS